MKKKLLFLVSIGLIFCSDTFTAQSKIAQPNEANKGPLQKLSKKSKKKGRKLSTPSPTHAASANENKIELPITPPADKVLSLEEAAVAMGNARITHGKNVSHQAVIMPLPAPAEHETVKIEFGDGFWNEDALYEDNNTPMASPNPKDEGNATDTELDDDEEALAKTLTLSLEKEEACSAPAADILEDEYIDPVLVEKQDNSGSGWWRWNLVAAATDLLRKGEEQTQKSVIAPVNDEKNELTAQEAADKKTEELLCEIKELEELLEENVPPSQRDDFSAQIEEKEEEIKALVEGYKVPEKKHSYLPKNRGMLASEAPLLLLNQKLVQAKKRREELKKQIDNETSKIAAIELPKLIESEEIKFHTTKKDEKRTSVTPDASAKTPAPQVRHLRPMIKTHFVVMETQKIKKGDSEVEVQVPVYKEATKTKGFDFKTLKLPKLGTDAKTDREKQAVLSQLSLEKQRVANTFNAVIQELNARNTKTKINKHIPNAAAYQHALKTKQPFTSNNPPRRKSLEKRVLAEQSAVALADKNEAQIEEIRKNKKARRILKNTILATALSQHKLDLRENTAEGYGRITPLNEITISEHPGKTERKGELKAERDRTRPIKQALEKAESETAFATNKAEIALKNTTQKLDSVLEQLEKLRKKEEKLRQQQNEESQVLAYAKVDHQLAKNKAEAYIKNRQALLDAHNATGGNSWF